MEVLFVYLLIGVVSVAVGRWLALRGRPTLDPSDTDRLSFLERQQVSLACGGGMWAALQGVPQKVISPPHKDLRTTIDMAQAELEQKGGVR